MDWFFDNLGAIATFLIILLYFLSNLKGGREEEPPSADDDADAEEARRIQEEIRRKIVERQRGGQSLEEPVRPPPPRAEEPVYRTVPAPTLRPTEGTDRSSRAGFPRGTGHEPPPVPAHQPEADPVFRMEDYEKRVQEQLRRAREYRERLGHASRSTPTMASSTRASAPLPSSSLRQALLADLSHPHSIKRAFLLKEILGTPVGQRSGPWEHTHH
ncbi:MAG: hypothetical protein EA425_15050 [Puniceicoccaceae bacterium]|nr:MAG: hypothetical protein EA425_15050 [Puniceicoccaceae bacterium]